MYIAEKPGIHFPDSTINGYYPLDDGNLLVAEEMLVYDALCFMHSYVESGLPAPDVIVGIGKGGLADMQRYAYLLGTKDPLGKPNVRVLTGQTEKYDEKNQPLSEIKVLHAPTVADLVGAQVILVCDDMIDKGGSLDAVSNVVEENAPEEATVFKGTAIAKQKPSGVNGTLVVASHADVVGRLVGAEWLQLSNQFETFKHWCETMREVRMKYPNMRQEMEAFSPEVVIPKLFPHLLAA